MTYEVHWASSNRADEMVAFRTGAVRHGSREAAEAEARIIKPPHATIVPIVVEVRKG
jgi:monoamine oxidase